MKSLLRFLLRILKFSFNTLRNISLAFTVLFFLFVYLVAQDPEGFADSLKAADHKETVTSFSFFGEDANPAYEGSRLIRVGGKRRFEEFRVSSFVYLQTSGPHYVKLAVKNKFIPNLHGDIKAIKARFPDSADHIFATGGTILNLRYVTSAGRDGITFRVELDDRSGHQYTIDLPAYKEEEFRSAWAKSGG